MLALLLSAAWAVGGTALVWCRAWDDYARLRESDERLAELYRRVRPDRMGELPAPTAEPELIAYLTPGLLQGLLLAAVALVAVGLVRSGRPVSALLPAGLAGAALWLGYSPAGLYGVYWVLAELPVRIAVVTAPALVALAGSRRSQPRARTGRWPVPLAVAAGVAIRLALNLGPGDGTNQAAGAAPLLAYSATLLVAGAARPARLLAALAGAAGLVLAAQYADNRWGWIDLFDDRSGLSVLAALAGGPALAVGLRYLARRRGTGEPVKRPVPATAVAAD